MLDQRLCPVTPQSVTLHSVMPYQHFFSSMSSISESTLLGAALLVATGIALKCRQSSLENGISAALSSGESTTTTHTAGNTSTIDALIGNTPLLKLEKLSAVLGVDIYVKVDGYRFI